MARAWLSVVGMCLWVMGAGAQSTVPTAAPLKKTCTVNVSEPNAAETALNKQDYKTAESQFRAMLTANAVDDAAHEGLIRTLLAEDQFADAVKEAEGWAAAEPASSMAMTALGEVRLRTANPRDAFALFQKAARADLCNARAYYGESRVNSLAGYDATAKREIEQAHTLYPAANDIGAAWESTRPRAERLKAKEEYAEHSDQITDEQRKQLKKRLEVESHFEGADCRMTEASPREATAPIVPVMLDPVHFLGFGLDVKLNGARWRLQLDTGASGILISRDVAKSLGIQIEEAGGIAGIGDEGGEKAFVGKVASVRIGNLEFANCMVEVADRKTVADTYGLIGGDVFARSLLTLDFPKRELRVAPLPARPDEKSASVGEEDEVAHDPYIAPEMTKWQWIYRDQHMLLMPTGIVETNRMKDEGAWSEKLFILDTGAFTNMISPEAARDVTKVQADGSLHYTLQGLSGMVKGGYEAGKFTLSFGGQRLDAMSMTSIDITKISDDIGVEVSGFLGAPALFQTVMHIDYRDNRVLFEYTPKR